MKFQDLHSGAHRRKGAVNIPGSEELAAYGTEKSLLVHRNTEVCMYCTGSTSQVM